MISSCSSLEVVAIQSSNWSFAVEVFPLFLFFFGEGVFCCFLCVFVGVFVAADADADVVDGVVDLFGAVQPSAPFPVGRFIKESTAETKESSVFLFFGAFFGGECFFAFCFVTW